MTVDNLGLTVELIPGCDGIGAVVQNFIDGIVKHDLAVKLVEDQWLALEGIRRDFNKKNRMYRNMDGAWNTLNSENAADFEEYLILAPKMVNMEERLERITDAKVKMKMEADYNVYLELEPRCARLEQAQKALEAAKELRDDAQALLLSNESNLTRLRADERLLATRITDDHIIADEKGMQIAHTFPNIQANNVLHSLNGKNTELLTYKEIMLYLKQQAPPHEAVFRRYDYRYDSFTAKWNSLQELREGGVCIDDPMMSKSEFVRCAAVGDFDAVKTCLLRGEDPNCEDYTGCTALLAAASNRHADVMELLYRAGASTECRDKNLVTPLLAAVMKGYLDVVRQLLEFGADRAVTDKNRRNVLYFAMTCGNLQMVNFFLNTRNSNEVESLWGFTPMHTAANLGNIELIKLLLTHGASLYIKCNLGRMPEDVAREAGYEEVTKFLENERFNAPAQLAFKSSDINVNIWIGEFSALDPVWTTDVGITEVICMPTMSQRPSNMAWLKDDDHCKHLTTLMDIDDEDISDKSWDTFAEELPKLATHLTSLIKKGDSEILICDPSGNSTSASLLCVALLMKYQTKITASLAACAVARPALKISLSLRKGLEMTQRSLDEKKLKRLDAKIRNAIIISGAF